MAGCRIERALAGDVKATIVRAKKECEKFRSRWDGDEKGGDYTLRTPLGPIEGTYTIHETHVVFLIASKPRLVPCSLIEGVLDQFLEDG